MADTNIDFHRTTKLTIETRVFDTFKVMEFTLTKEDGATLKMSAITNDFDLEIEDKGTRVV